MTALTTLSYFMGGLMTRIFGDMTVIGIFGLIGMIILMVSFNIPLEMTALLGTATMFLFVAWGILNPAFVWLAWGGLALVLTMFAIRFLRGY